jgi:alpha-glucosidase
LRGSSVEGIAGNEEFPTPAHNAALPFTRFLTGPAVYTCCWYSSKLKVTHAHQLALPVIYFSPWQVLLWYDRPSQYRGDPALDFWNDLPACWDETRVLADSIGRCASLVRRRGTEWFVGTINRGAATSRSRSRSWNQVWSTRQWSTATLTWTTRLPMP